MKESTLKQNLRCTELAVQNPVHIFLLACREVMRSGKGVEIGDILAMNLAQFFSDWAKADITGVSSRLPQKLKLVVSANFIANISEYSGTPFVERPIHKLSQMAVRINVFSIYKNVHDIFICGMHD